jgi:GNAT superfamily N-acetyltransferase
MRIVVESPVRSTARVLQVRGMFDLAPATVSRLEWDVNLPLDDRTWHIGLIVGPSGCGKSTIARHLFSEALAAAEKLPEWPSDGAIVDGFPENMSVKLVISLLSSVGFSSPPAWLRPYHVLSTGERFRADLARLLAYTPELVVMDEYTSMVDRTVARVGSAALAKTVRRLGRRFVAITCHEDVEAWLQPDWTFCPATNTFTWRCLQPRPSIRLAIYRCTLEAWSLFRPHHYLSSEISPAAVAFLAEWQRRPVAFSAWINALTKHGGKREHRTVTLPDYQGVGVGHRLSNFCAALWKALGHRAVSTTSHPAFIAARLTSTDWRLTRSPALAKRPGRRHSAMKHSRTRLTAGFEYVGPGLDRGLAQRLV